MRLPLAILIAVGACALASGCRSNSQLVEAELRKREIETRELREELDRCAAYNRALQLDVRGTLDGAGPAFPLRSLTLGRQTGGREIEGSSGDGALQVVLEPRDAEGQSIKIPNAAAVIQVTEIGPDGLKSPLSTWEIPPEQLRNNWRSGLLTTGYVLVLPWKEPPTTEKLRVTALLRLLDGRAFEADKDVTVRLPSGTKRRVMPPPQAAPVPADGPLLPAPRLVDPAKPEAARDRPAPQMVARRPYWDWDLPKPKPRPSTPPASIGQPVPIP